MKIHILKKDEGLKDVLEKYQISYESFKLYNPKLLECKIGAGDKIIIPEIKLNQNILN